MTSIRNVQLAAAVVGVTLVMIFGPRMDGPRIMCGVKLTTKTGAPGLTDFGFFLLVAVPAVAYVLAGIVGRALAAGRSRPRDER